MIAQYTAAVVVSTYTGGSHDPAERGLREALDFYPHGFHRINRLLHQHPGYMQTASRSLGLSDVMRFFLQAFFALLFWALTFVAAVRYVGLWRDSAMGKLIAGPRVTAKATPTPQLPASMGTPERQDNVRKKKSVRPSHQ
jgi:hypothetical protein